MPPQRQKIPKHVKTMGEAIRVLREKRGLTLRALASKVEISPPFLSDIEHDRRNTDKLKEIARALNADLRDLRKFDTRLTTDLKHWISGTPGVVDLLRDIRASGRTPEELRASLKRRGD